MFSRDGFEWVDLGHPAESVVAFRRRGRRKSDDLLVILNLTPVVRNAWEIIVSGKPYRREIFNSDNTIYWGSGSVRNLKIRCKKLDGDQLKYRLLVDLPALSGIVLK